MADEEKSESNPVIEALKREIQLRMKSVDEWFFDAKENQLVARRERWGCDFVVGFEHNHIKISGGISPIEIERIPLETFKPRRLAASIARYLDSFARIQHEMKIDFIKNALYNDDEK